MSSRRDFLRLRATPEPEVIDEDRRRSLALMILLCLVCCVMTRAATEKFLEWLFADVRRAEAAIRGTLTITAIDRANGTITVDSGLGGPAEDYIFMGGAVDYWKVGQKVKVGG